MKTREELYPTTGRFWWEDPDKESELLQAACAYAKAAELMDEDKESKSARAMFAEFHTRLIRAAWRKES